MFKLILKIKQHFCKHKYRKHYEPKLEEYVYRCPKCGKVVIP